MSTTFGDTEADRIEKIEAQLTHELQSLFRDAASVNMTEAAVKRQAIRFAEAIISRYDLKPKTERWEVGKNGWDASDEATREDI